LRIRGALRTILVILLAVSASSADQAEVRRYLLSAGANNGGRERVLLQYAVSDARAFASVLTDMGGVDKNSAFVLSNPSSGELLYGIAQLNRLITKHKAASPDVRSEVFVYYSGHADGIGLKLGSETLSWSDFRSAVNGINADVRVAILDACGSGAITRTKGGVALPAFMSDASYNMKGYAFLTSSNENEASQESDRLKGSFFTHALLSGMRGAADLTGDGIVTINEAYQFAFNETLQNTQNTSGGTQHPSRDMNLAGTGDIVMTDLRETSAILSLGPDMEGRFFIRDEKGNLFAELGKARGRAIDLGIPPGKYTVRTAAPSGRWAANSIVIAEGQKITLTMNEMTAMPRSIRTVSRGNAPDGVSDSANVYYYDEEDDGFDGDSDAEPEDLPDSLALAAELPPSFTQSDIPVSVIVINPMLDSACNSPYRFNSRVFITGSGKPERGLQLSLLLSDARAEYCGTQISLLANSARRYMNGTQAAAAVNIAMSSGNLVQVAPINLAAAEINGVQVGAMNLVHRSVSCAQAGIINFAESVGYVQAGAVNIADSVGYVQLGAVNFASDIDGSQIGVINFAGRVKRPVGIINIAGYSERTPIGLINIVGNGFFDATYYVETTGDMGFMLRAGTPWLYSMAEYNQPIGGFEMWPRWLGFGMGTNFGMKPPITVSLDAVWATIYYDYYLTHQFDWDPDVVDALRLTHGELWFTDGLLKSRLGINGVLTPFMTLTAGISVNTLIEGGARKWWKNNPGDQETDASSGGYINREPNSYRARVWQGFYAGITLGTVGVAGR